MTPSDLAICEERDVVLVEEEPLFPGKLVTSLVESVEISI